MRLVVFVAIVVLGAALPAGASPSADRTAVLRAAQHATAEAVWGGVDVVVREAVEYVEWAGAAEVEAGIAAALDDVARFTGQIEADQAAARAAAARAPVVPAARSGGHGGCCSAGQLAALNQCEASGGNGWRTGRYGLEAGYPVGSMSDADQAAWVQRIYDQSGAHAWGPMCAPILGG